MKLADFSVSRPVTVIMIILALLLIGAVSLGGLSLDLLPEINLPVAVVVTSYEGSAPQEVENLITRPLEEVLGTVGNIKSISSISSMGSSVVVAQFEMETDMDFAALEMREKIDLVRDFLPEGAGDPMVLKLDLNMMPVLLLGLSGDRPAEELKTIAEDVLKPRLERLDGVASVEVSGGLTRQIQVLVEPEKLSAYGLSLAQVVQTLQAQNLNLSAGRVARGGQELALRIIGEYSAISQIAETALMTPTGGLLRLKDIAEIKDTYKVPSTYSRMRDRPSVTLSVQKQSGANTVSVVREVRRALEELKGRLPGDINTFTVMDQAKYIEFSLRNVAWNLVLGGLLAALVLFVFLRSLRSTLVIAFSMPISVVATFILIYFGKLTLNMMTLGGLALGIGMMVDSSIVVLENIFRHREKGLGPIEAAKTGTAEVANAICASVLTTVAVFFPIVFITGIVSEIFTALALTVSFALLSSLLVALTLIPMFSSRLLTADSGSVPGFSAKKVKNSEGAGPGGSESSKGRSLTYRLIYAGERHFKNLEAFYRRLLELCLRRRALTVGLVAAALAGTMVLVPVIGAEFIPAMDQGMILVDIELPHGSRLEETDKIVSRVEEAFSPYEEDIELIYAIVGGGSMGALGGMGAGGQRPSVGGIYVTLVPLEQRKHTTAEIVAHLRQEVAAIPGAEISVTAMEASFSLGMSSAPVEISLKGEDLAQLRLISHEIASILRDIPGTREVSTSLEEGQPEIQLLVKRDKADFYGLSAAQIASAARQAIEGQVATRFRTGTEEIDVWVRLAGEARRELASIENLLITSPLGQMVPLGEVAEIREVKAPVAIQRSDQMRVVSITSQLEGRPLAAVIQEAQRAIQEKIVLPPGYSVSYGGEFELMSESFQDLFVAMLLALVLVYMVLAAQFESLLHPFVIMFSLPVTVIGVILALVLTETTFNVVTFIGVIMLAGIVVNNAIVLVDYINQLRQRGLKRDEAILTAGPIRLRPILMTALTTILAMIPLAFGTGEGAQMQASLAVAVIGGLTASTFLTLVFVPVIYTLFDDLKGLRQKRRQKYAGNI